MTETKPTPFDYLRAIFFYAPEKTDPVYFGGRVLFFVILVAWAPFFWFHSVESNYVGSSFLHNVNLPFHEAGHIIFRPFGRFITVLGGSLGQLLMPFIILCVFIIKNRNPFAGSVALWWIGQNFMDMAPYIADARSLDLILIGGGTGKDVEDFHDWEYLLGVTGLSEYDRVLGATSHFFGIYLMALALLWGGYMLYKQSRSLDTGRARQV